MNLEGLGGRPTVYSDELAEKALHYLEHYDDHEGDVLPTIERMALKLRVACSTLYLWAEDKDHPFHIILGLVNCTQSADLINKGLNKKFDASVTRLLLGKHGYTEKKQTEISGPGGNAIAHTDLTTVDEEELDRLLAQKETDLDNIGHD